MTQPCPDCGTDVLTQPNGTRLEARRSRFGTHFPDGTHLSTAELERIRGQPLKAHARHFCTPRPPAPPPAEPDPQLGLF